ncbi:MAG: hypothetical protein IKS06_08345 [Lachnospiraceae bacterium]|nr:hypothetical protein [Lachnospiraceae bacterium]
MRSFTPPYWMSKRSFSQEMAASAVLKVLRILQSPSSGIRIRPASEMWPNVTVSVFVALSSDGSEKMHFL